jgi:hypothetical protein
MKHLFVFVALLFIGCNTRPTVNYEVVENKKYDVPAKSQISKRIVLKDSVSKDQIKEILNYEFGKCLNTRMEFHNPPSHIFIYVYSPTIDWQKNSAAWEASMQRIKGSEEKIKFNDFKFLID